MASLVQGIHHITLCPGAAQEDLDFYTEGLGQRLVKQTVLMDGRIPIYHFYWGNGDAEVGSIATSFPYSRRLGRPRSGQGTVNGDARPASPPGRAPARPRPCKKNPPPPATRSSTARFKSASARSSSASGIPP